MGQYTSYYLYQKYETRGSQEAIPVYPNVYSIDADGTRERVVKIQDDPQCGYDPPIKPIYKWVNIPITQDYICDDCPEYQTRWVRTDETICSGTPTPTVKKLVATYTGGITNEVECNSSTELTTGETKPSGYEASAMTSAVIGNCVTTIGSDAFYLCSGLTSCTIGSGVTTIGNDAFGGCNNLTRVNSNVNGYCNIPDNVITIADSAFRVCENLTNITIPNNVTSIGDMAFLGCRRLTSVNIPIGITSIENYVFSGCTNLSSVTIPSGVTRIKGEAFNSCFSLTSITIPNSVTRIGDNAFLKCSGLTSITCLATTPPTLDSFGNQFANTNNCPIYVPCQSVDAYKSAENWNTYASRIQGIPPCGETSKKLVANYRDGETLEVDCNGDGTLTSGETQPSGYEKNRMTSAVIENCVQSIGAEALRNCTSLTSVTISNSVTTIDYWAFGGCSGLTSVTIPNSVTSIGYAAFAHCSGLTSATISNSLTRIGTLAFWSCRSLTSVAIPNSVTSIGDGAFSDCSGLTSINIPNSVTNIGERVFSDCTSLTSVTIGNSVTNIDGWAFLNCSGLTGVTVLATTPPSLGTDVFDYTNDCPLLVVASSLNAYKEAWPQYASRIQAIP